MARKKALPKAEKPSEGKTKLKKNATKKPSSAKKTAKSAKKTGVRATKAKIESERNPPSKPKPKRIRKPHATRPTVQEEFEIYERRKRVLDLKKSGASVRRIAALLQSEGHKSFSPATVQADLNFILDENDGELAMSALQYRALMVEQMEDQYFRIRSSMIKNVTEIDSETGEEIRIRKEVFDEDKENLLIRNRAFVDKLVGASKAQQSKNAANEALAKLLGCDPAQIGKDEETTNDESTDD